MSMPPLRPMDISASLDGMADVIRKKNNPAQFMQERMLERILRQQEMLSLEEELGIVVVGGAAPTFHLRQISYSNPDILIFTGLDPDGNPIQIMQHHSQMSIVVISVPKITAEPFRIGFTKLRETP